MPRPAGMIAVAVLALTPWLAAAQQPLSINPPLPPPPFDSSRHAPVTPDTPEPRGSQVPDAGGTTLTPRLTPPSSSTDPIPSDRRQERVPSFRLKVPL